ALRVDVSVEQGGLELIRVSDDGSGIPADELPLAVASHATSKIRNADDLFRVRTLGFRGEALASIAEISRLVLRSRTDESVGGAQLEITGGESLGVSPCAAPIGTTVEVRQLFYNTPVRRKFQRSTQTEMGHVAEAFIRLALANPHVHCTLRHNGRIVYDLPLADDWRSRIAAFFGDDLAADLIAVSSSEEGVYVAGHVASPTHSRANARLQYLFLNGRAIRDRSLQHALGEAYRGLLLTGRYPIAFLRIEMPSDQVDVNVHPTKLEVRFQESGRLYSQLLGTLRSKFLSTDLTARLQSNLAEEAAAAIDPARADQMRRDLVDWAKGQLQVEAALVPLPADSQLRFDAAMHAARAPLELNTLERRWQGVGTDDDESLPDAGEVLSFDPNQPREFSGQWRPAALQLHNRYLITESDDGMVVIDQHALHERILYEQLREKVLSGSVESQALLVPEPVDLAPAERAVLAEAGEVLEKLGIAVAPFGGDTVLVSSYPAMLANFRPGEVLRDLIGRLLDGRKSLDRRDLVDSLLHMIACKAAIKAGDRLTGEEMGVLLEQRHLVQDTHHCPHGRPSALFFSREELDKQFKRT
ncbi:MAG TPA: DNA mismatch repair endonuclease MutL, partial [Pirellulales bacterium]|nr:DNA mismatch repair endonuclease MutL [Pirellulales bacterium]